MSCFGCSTSFDQRIKAKTQQLMTGSILHDKGGVIRIENHCQIIKTDRAEHAVYTEVWRTVRWVIATGTGIAIVTTVVVEVSAELAKIEKQTVAAAVHADSPKTEKEKGKVICTGIADCDGFFCFFAYFDISASKK